MDDRRLSIPPDATPEEAAAITAALEAHLATVRAAAADDTETEPGWTGRRWAFAGRLEATTGDAGRRVPDGTPADAWTAAARRDRF
jgi:hypothetical protein